MGAQITKSQQFRNTFPTNQFRILPSDPYFHDLMIIQQIHDSTVLAASFIGPKNNPNQKSIKNKHVLMRQQKYQKDKKLYQVFQWSTANVQGLVDYVTKIDKKRKISKIQYKAILQGAIKGYSALYRQAQENKIDYKNNKNNDNKQCLCINMNNLRIFNQVVLKVNEQNTKQIVNKIIVKVVPQHIKNYETKEQRIKNKWPNVDQCKHQGGSLTQKQHLGMYMLQLGHYVMKIESKNSKQNVEKLKKQQPFIGQIVEGLINNQDWNTIIKLLQNQPKINQKNLQQEKNLKQQVKNLTTQNITFKRLQSQKSPLVSKVRTIQHIQQIQALENAQKARQNQLEHHVQKVQKARQNLINQHTQLLQQAQRTKQVQQDVQYYRQAQLNQKAELIKKDKQTQQAHMIWQASQVQLQKIQQNLQIQQIQQARQRQRIQQAQRIEQAQLLRRTQQKNQQARLIQQAQKVNNNRKAQQSKLFNKIQNSQIRQGQTPNNQKVQRPPQFQNVQQYQQRSQVRQIKPVSNHIQQGLPPKLRQVSKSPIIHDVQQVQKIERNQQAELAQIAQQFQQLQKLDKPKTISMKLLPSQNNSNIMISQKAAIKTQNNLFSFVRKQNNDQNNRNNTIICPQDQSSFLRQTDRSRSHSRIIIRPQIDLQRRQSNRVVIYGNEQQLPYDHYQLINKINHMNSNTHFKSLSPVRTQNQNQNQNQPQNQIFISPPSIKFISQQKNNPPLLTNSRQSLINKLDEPVQMQKTNSFIRMANNNENMSTYDKQRGIIVSNKVLGQYFSPEHNHNNLTKPNINPPKPSRKQSIAIPIIEKQQKNKKQTDQITKIKKMKGKKIQFISSKPNQILMTPFLLEYKSKTKPDFCDNQILTKQQHMKTSKQSKTNLNKDSKNFLSQQFNEGRFSLNNKNSRQINRLIVSPCNNKPKIPIVNVQKIQQIEKRQNSQKRLYNKINQKEHQSLKASLNSQQKKNQDVRKLSKMSKNENQQYQKNGNIHLNSKVNSNQQSQSNQQYYKCDEIYTNQQLLKDKRIPHQEQIQRHNQKYLELNQNNFNPRKVRSNIENLSIEQANSQVLLIKIGKSPKSIKNYNNNNNNNTHQNSIVKSFQILQQRKQSKYVGPVNIKGQKQGQGKLIFLSGGCYIGEFSKDFMHGQGKMYYPSGKLAYQGNFKNDKFDGYGKLYNQNPSFITVFDFRNFNKIEATEKQKQTHRQNFLINPIKSQKKISYWKTYQGEMKNDMKNGKGKLLLQNGQKFQGEFINDLVHGKGIFYGKNQTIKGLWQNSMLTQVYR